jgi:hypothetical protein
VIDDFRISVTDHALREVKAGVKRETILLD